MQNNVNIIALITIYDDVKGKKAALNTSKLSIYDLIKYIYYDFF